MGAFKFEGLKISDKICYNIETDVYMEILMSKGFYPDREGLIERILCNRCSHLHNDMTCNAFPNGIPMAIIRNGENFLPVDGDNGIVFEEKRISHDI